MRDISINLIPVLDKIPIGVCLLGKDRRIVFMNKAIEVLTGFSRAECVGLPCSHVLRVNNCFENCPVGRMKESESCVLEGDIINQQNEKIPVHVTFASLMDESGQITAYIETLEDLRQIHRLDPARMNPFSFGRIVGRSPEMEKIFQFLPDVAQLETPVLITGQIGTGKDLLAEELHRASLRADKPFVTFHCGVLPEFLAESELFGVEKDAFPGAVKKPGKFRLAQNGTIYIAEIGELAPSLQTRLLNLLDEKIIYPLGSSKSFPADVRIIAATSRDLGQMVQEGTFRSELYFRLNAVSLQLPPLNQRGEDLRLLLDHFLHSHAQLLNKAVSGFSDACLEKLLEYGYPGNVLELRHIVEYAVSLCRADKIELRDLPAYLTEDSAVLDATSPISTSSISKSPISKSPGSTSPNATSAISNSPDSKVSILQVPSDKADGPASLDWSAVERKMIMDALLKTNGRRSTAARLLGWGRSTLWRKMKHYRIASEGPESEIGSRE